MNKLRNSSLSTESRSMPEYYTAKEAAAVLGIKYTTLVSQVHAGRYKSRKFKSLLLLNKKEIDKAAKDAASSKTMDETTR